MIELIELYEVQKEKYQPIISQFERELAYYIGSDLSEFKLHIPNFRNYLNSDNFKTKFSTALRDFRVSIERSKISDGQIGKDVTTVNAENQCKPLTAGDFAALLTQFLDNIAAHQITIPNVTLVEILYSLANPNNFRLKRQEALNKQVFIRLDNQPQKNILDSNMPICNCINGFCTIGDLWMVVVKNEFDETDLQYPLLLALALSHSSPRHVKTFLDKQPSQYKGDFTKVLETAILEYDDLLLNSQIKEAHQWLNEYKPPYIETAEIIDIIEDDIENIDITPIDIKETTTIKVKPTINLNIATIVAIYEALQPHFELSEQDKLNTLLQGDTIEGTICFRGQASTLMAFFRDLLDKKVVISGHTDTARWLNFYFTANKQREGKNQPLIEKTALNYFRDLEKNPHYLIDIRPILQKITQKK